MSMLLYGIYRNISENLLAQHNSPLTVAVPRGPKNTPRSHQRTSLGSRVLPYTAPDGLGDWAGRMGAEAAGIEAEAAWLRPSSLGEESRAGSEVVRGSGWKVSVRC